MKTFRHPWPAFMPDCGKADVGLSIFFARLLRSSSVKSRKRDVNARSMVDNPENWSSRPLGCRAKDLKPTRSEDSTKIPRRQS
jgi:hypothetical protein